MEDKFNNKYRIETCRLSGWDYSRSGFYFITICTINRELFFGTVHTQNFASASKMTLSKIGKIAQKYWLEIPNHFPFITLDEYVIMPNHIHGILEIKKPNVGGRDDNYKNKFGPQSKNISSIIRGFKIGVKKYATINNIPFNWQPRFYDHIIRDNNALKQIRQYIVDNPKKWEKDRNNSKKLYM